MLIVHHKLPPLVGAHGVGRRHIKNSLISHFPEKYAYPIARKFEFLDPLASVSKPLIA